MATRHKHDDRRGRARLLEAIQCVAPAIICCLLLLGGLNKAEAQSDNPSEYRVKLAFLYNFAQFIEWPDSAFSGPTAPLNICIVGQDPFGGEIGEALRGRKVGAHPIQIARLKADGDAKACHMLFVRASEKAAARKIVASIKGTNILAVGESDGFADLGGAINLTLVENKLRFEINLDAAKRNQLKISSKLLALAKIIRVEGNP